MRFIKRLIDCLTLKFEVTVGELKTATNSRGIARFPCDSTAFLLRKGAVHSKNSVFGLDPYVNFGEMIVMILN